jgi:adenylylsulfate kinase-like enzyme
MGGGFFFGLAFYRRLNIHEQQIGDSHIKVKHADLSKLVPICVQLAECEKLKAASPERYITELTKLMSLHHKYLQTAFGPEQQPTQALPAHVPTFSDLLHAGELTHSDSLVIGILPTGVLKRVNWMDFVSSSLAGQSGSGKTSTVRSIVAQAALQPHKMTLYILDGHNGHPEALSSSLSALNSLPNVIIPERFKTQQTVKQVLQIIHRRLHGELPCDEIVLVVMDELAELIRAIPETRELIDQIGSRSRKVRVFGIFATQAWPAKLLGGSDIRDNLISTISHKAKRRQAQILFDDNHIAKKVARLQCGQLIGRGRGFDEEQIITVPYCATSDIDQVYQKCQLLKATSDIDQVYQKCQLLKVDKIDRHEPGGNRGIDTLTILKGKLNSGVITQKDIVVSTGIDKGLLSNVLSGKRAMSTAVNQKLQDFVADPLIHDGYEDRE